VSEPELTCRELTELITDYLEERLPPSDRLRFEQHLSICDGCVTYIDQMRATMKALRVRPRVEIPQSVESKMLQAFRSWKVKSTP
jgi:anti-sigma factor RsiW